MLRRAAGIRELDRELERTGRGGRGRDSGHGHSDDEPDRWKRRSSPSYHDYEDEGGEAARARRRRKGGEDSGKQFITSFSLDSSAAGANDAGLESSDEEEEIGNQYDESMAEDLWEVGSSSSEGDDAGGGGDGAEGGS